MTATSPTCGAKKPNGQPCKNLVNRKGDRCRLHPRSKQHVVKTPKAVKPVKPQDWQERMIVQPGLWINLRSETRPEIIHHIYTGDSVNTPHCSCESYRWGTVVADELYTCKHIELVVFGKGAA